MAYIGPQVKKERINLFAKSGLARLMAQENIQVIHDGSLDTAAFDPKGRIVYLPVLENMTGFHYDWYIAHETAHALFSPHDMDEIKRKLGDCPFSFYNITEDARIEKFIKRKYPGTKIDAKLFYDDFCSVERDVFGLHGPRGDLEKLTTIDRINLYFKAGHNVKISFRPEEIKFVDAVQAQETSDQALKNAKDIFEFMKQDKQLIPQDATGSGGTLVLDDDTEFDFDGDGGDSGNQPDVIIDKRSDKKRQEDAKKAKEAAKKNGGKNKGKGISVADADSSDDADDTKDGDKQGDKDGSQTKGGSQSGKQKTSPLYIDAGSTQKAMDKAMKDMISISGKQTGFGDVAQHDKTYSKGVLGSDEMAPRFQQPLKESSDYFNFIRKITPTIGMMASIFNQKKSAQDYQKILSAKTGRLDMDKMVNYKFSDDLFLRSEVMPEAKNHGMVMIIDWSSSMSGNIFSTIKQLIILMEFCRKIGIPFEVYGFTTQYNKNESFPVKKNEVFSSSSGAVFSLFSSSTPRQEFIKQSQIVYDACSRGGGDAIHSMGGTPLVFSCFMAEYLIKEFQEKTKVEKTVFVLLTDGEGTDSVKNHQGVLPKIVMRNPDSGKNYEFDNNRSVFHQVLKYVKDRCNVSKMMGFYLCSSSIRDSEVSLLSPHDLVVNKSKIKDLSTINADLKKNRYVEFPKSLAFDRFFAVDVNNFQLDETNYLKSVDTATSKMAAKTALQQELTKSMSSMIFMKLFTEEIS